MRATLLVLILLSATAVHAQDRVEYHNTYQNRLYNAFYMERPPVFGPGKDSLNRLYFAHFPAFELVIGKAVEKGDTAKYIRINFSYNIDTDGSPYEPQFISVSSTQYKSARNGKLIKYFADDKEALQQAVKTLVAHIPQRWTPGIEAGRAVRSRCEDFVQVWVGLGNPPE